MPPRRTRRPPVPTLREPATTPPGPELRIESSFSLLRVVSLSDFGARNCAAYHAGHKSEIIAVAREAGQLLSFRPPVTFAPRNRSLVRCTRAMHGWSRPPRRGRVLHASPSSGPAFAAGIQRLLIRQRHQQNAVI